MVQLLRHIDAIARQEGFGVLYITFGINPNIPSSQQRCPEWETMPIRQQIIDWLYINDYAWKECFEIASENSITPYMGTIYVKVPYEVTNMEFQKLRDYLENQDGTIRYQEVSFNYLPLETAMRNKHHDVPGFWQTWAKNF
jgi:hypothetical protein